MKNKLFITVTALLLAVVLSAGALASSVYFTGDSNVRSGPGLDYSKKGSVNRGSYLTYLGETSYDGRGVAWYKVSFGGGAGWVSSKYSYVSQDSGSASYGAGGSGNAGYSDGGYGYYDDELAGNTVTAVSGNTTVRTGPGLGYASLGTMYRGESAFFYGDVRYDSRGVAWYMIRWCGEDGWVSSRYTIIE